MSLLEPYMGMYHKATAQLGGGNNTLLIIGIVIAVIAICVGIYALFKYTKSAEKRGFNAINHEFNDRNTLNADGTNQKEAEIMLFYVDWCPHCKTAKPEWEQVKAEYDGKTINGYIVTFTEINCTNESPDVEKLMNTYKIEGYPTIKLLKDGTIIEYDAKPSKDTLVQFLNTVL